MLQYEPDIIQHIIWNIHLTFLKNADVNAKFNVASFIP